jgi:hypothetical protein
MGKSTMDCLQDNLTDSEKTVAGDTGDFEISPLGKRLMEIRRKFIAEGGKLLSREELAQEIAERRGGVYASQCEENYVR